MTKNVGDEDSGAEEHDRELSDGAMAKGMRSDSDDASYCRAWREFDRRHLPHVKAFIESRAADLGAAICDDLLSETLQRIQKGIDQYADRGQGKLRSWCFKIADRVVHDLWRGRLHSVQDGPPGQPELVSFSEVEDRFVGGLVTADEVDYAAILIPSKERNSSIVSERARILWTAFRSLTDIDQAVIWGKEVNRDTDAYVAHIIGKPVDHVRKIREKAVKKLRKRFEQLLETSRAAS